MALRRFRATALSAAPSRAVLIVVAGVVNALAHSGWALHAIWRDHPSGATCPDLAGNWAYELFPECRSELVDLAGLVWFAVQWLIEDLWCAH